ncbi:MAPEG family protein [Marinomonas posidonica]|uniref:Membrane-associated protein in eicosanoid and glutathione metabolism (MAPEG) n=1 Tax=Marinomonas posidonica (strain CECT 7376 / NCIMB 14433 / IVIA-Po-181) TaxID=491952 RepID=F6CV98_MARPP|nr:MAPEG family protein [Marinomonas posidonica]AEF54208.1 hypothetical protein Mar181_1160 [Marinomonas posidonica IVIA-Po-181]
MSELEITSIAASILAILMFPLTVQISMRRAALGKAVGDMKAVVFGDGNDEKLRRRIRAFGNFIEYAPMCLIMLGLLENASAGKTLVWSVACLLIAGRMIHALGMLYADNPTPRGIGMFMTYISFLMPAGWLLLNL